MHLLRAALLLLLTLPALADAPKSWHGYPRHDFAFEGRPATIVAPLREAARMPGDGGRAWVWKARFLDHRPDLDLALLDQGFTVAFLEDTAETLGSPECVAAYDRFHDHVVKEFGLSPRAALEGLSRGGLYVYNYAAADPDKVACVYADCPVLDFKSWPAGKGVFPNVSGPGSKGSWEALKKSYGFKSDDEARVFTGNPVDNLEPIAVGRVPQIPLLHVIGEIDPVVPPAENTLLLKKNLERRGGTMTLIVKAGEKHSHGVGDVSVLAKWVIEHTCGAGNARPVLCRSEAMLGVAPADPTAKRVLILGDSITQAGRWVDYVAQVLAVRYPERPIEIINIGLSSETTSGLSEEGHADGKFPRPDLHERLGRALERVKPEVVIACYGMNDGIYKPLADDRFAAFKKGMTKLQEEVTRKAWARLVVLTPPVFDPVPIAKRTTADGAGGPFKGYDDVLAAYGAWELSQRSVGWDDVGDLHGLMSAALADRRKADPAFTFSKDGVHPGATGHWLMALALLRTLGVPPEGDVAAVEAGEPRASRGNVGDLRMSDAGELSFTWLVRRPMPRDPELEKDAALTASPLSPAKFDARRLSVSGLKAPRYALYEGQTLLGEFAREELAKGIDVATLDKFSANAGGDGLRKAIHERMTTLGDAWRTAVGHLRPGVNKGKPLDEAERIAASLSGQIRGHTAPVRAAMRVVPVKG